MVQKIRKAIPMQSGNIVDLAERSKVLQHSHAQSTDKERDYHNFMKAAQDSHEPHFGDPFGQLKMHCKAEEKDDLDNRDPLLHKWTQPPLDELYFGDLRPSKSTYIELLLSDDNQGSRNFRYKSISAILISSHGVWAGHRCVKSKKSITVAGFMCEELRSEYYRNPTSCFGYSVVTVFIFPSAPHRLLGRKDIFESLMRPVNCNMERQRSRSLFFGTVDLPTLLKVLIALLQ